MNNIILLRNPWPTAIIGFFAFFISAVVSFIVFAVRHPMDLVRPDYYEAEVRYQRHFDSLQRTQLVAAEVKVAYDAVQQCVSIALPAAHRLAGLNGHVQFYRPSDAGLDHVIPLAVDPTGRQQVDVRTLRHGLWKVRVHWQVKDAEFFCDRAVVLAGQPGGS